MRDAGKTIFVVTHQASLLEGVADEFVWMEAGQITSRTRELRPVETAMSMSAASPSGVTGATLAKDLRLEWRSKDAHQLHAVFFPAGGRGFQLFLRSQR